MWCYAGLEFRGSSRMVAVGTILSDGPPHRSQRALLTHWAPTSGVWRQSAHLDEDV